MVNIGTRRKRSDVGTRGAAIDTEAGILGDKKNLGKKMVKEEGLRRGS